MNGEKFIAVLWVCFFSFLAHAEQPFQNWLTLNLGQRLDYALEAMVEYENKWQDDEPTWKEFFLEPSLVWHYSPRYDFAVGYMWTEMHEAQDNHSWHEAILAGTVKLPVKEWKFSSRQRFQFGSLEDQFTWMFRQLTRVEYDNAWLQRIRPFIADEWFYDIEEEFLSENRFYGGINYEILPSCMIEIYGMWQSVWMADGMHRDGPVVGTMLQFAF
ncbi:MAG: DUF2490 domain-containing protein [Verrucomicrobiota bacterium]